MADYSLWFGSSVTHVRTLRGCYVWAGAPLELGKPLLGRQRKTELREPEEGVRVCRRRCAAWLGSPRLWWTASQKRPRQWDWAEGRAKLIYILDSWTRPQMHQPLRSPSHSGSSWRVPGFCVANLWVSVATCPLGLLTLLSDAVMNISPWMLSERFKSNFMSLYCNY